MTPEKWQRAEELFHRALDVPEGERASWLKGAFAGDAELQAEVESLLASDEAAGEAFVARQIEPVAAELFEDHVPRPALERVGPYRVVREIGRGGMGAVYLAERDDDQYHTQVAIKLVRRGMDTDLILHRFYRERQTLARLQHTNIARLLDGGTTTGGEPYIVMEYVDGDRITDYCRERKLSVRQRLTLFLDVLKAVDYAHRQFVVHRDLKPGNILVDRAGTVKLLDFGICKLLLQDEDVSANATIGGLPGYTPNYASPEQIRAEPITVASDVYSAAAVLYELLTGLAPHRITDLTPRGIERAICEEEIRRPSEAAAPAPGHRQLAGDVDNILLHALEKEAARRYETIEQFAEDIRRFLAYEPVRARPGTLAYRVQKFVQRRSGLVAASAAVSLTMAGGVAVSWRSARIANENLGMVRKLSNTFVFDVYDAVKELPGSTEARELIVKTGLEYLDNLSRNASGDRALQKELAAAYVRIGDVQGNVMWANLGRTSDAVRSYDKALALWKALREADQNDKQAALEEIRVQRRMAGVFEYTKAPAQARERYREAMALAKRLRDQFPDDTAVVTLWAGVQTSEGLLLNREGDFSRARELFGEAVAVLQSLLTKHAGNPDIEANLAAAISGQAVSDVRLGRLREGLEAYRKGIEWRERQVARFPANAGLKRGLMFEYSHAGDVLGNPNVPNLGDRAGAAEVYGKMVEVARQLHEADPKDQRGRSDYGIALSRVAAVLPDTSAAEKIRLIRQAIALMREVEKATPDNRMNRSELVYNYNFLGDVLEVSGDLKGARQAYQDALQLAEPLLSSATSTLLTAAALVYRKVGILEARSGQRESALASARRAYALARPDQGQAKKRPREFQRFFEVRASTAMGLIHAALARSTAGTPQDRTEARRWLHQSLERYEALAKLPSFSNTHRREVTLIRKALETLP